MPAVRMLTSLATQRHAWRAGEVVQATPSEAEEWLADGVAELVREDRAETPEGHTTSGMETTEVRRTRRRSRG